MFWITILYQVCVLQYIFLSVSCSSFILLTVPHIAEIFNLKKCSLFFLSWIVLLVFCLKSHHHTQGHLEFFSWIIFKSFYSSVFYIWVCDPFSVNFCVWSMPRHFYRWVFSYSCTVEKLSLLHYIVFTPLSKVGWPCLYGSVLELSVLFDQSVCLFVHHYHMFLVISYIVNLEDGYR